MFQILAICYKGCKQFSKIVFVKVHLEIFGIPPEVDDPCEKRERCSTPESTAFAINIVVCYIAWLSYDGSLHSVAFESCWPCGHVQVATKCPSSITQRGTCRKMPSVAQVGQATFRHVELGENVYAGEYETFATPRSQHVLSFVCAAVASCVVVSILCQDVWTCVP